MQHTNTSSMTYERRLDHESILLRSGRAVASREDRGEDRSDEAWRQIQWGEPLF